ncbi:MAG: glutathione peroxidase [Rikenellaceae bacterium]|nr:glutathione peroxidase [Rikenellaceae bacterium]
MKRVIFALAVSLAFSGNTFGQESPVVPPVDFYSLSFTSITGRTIDFSAFKGRKVLLVNTASKCGYTPQFADLEELSVQYIGELAVVGFPSNDFGGQDPGSNADILEFCQKNYGVTFLMMEKSAVKGEGKNPVFQWLTDPAKNGWNSQGPEWNFWKYLIDEQGRLAAVFPSKVKPSGEGIASLLSKK